MVNKDIRCCYNCNKCVAFFGPRMGGTFCMADCSVVYRIFRVTDCEDFEQGHYQTKLAKDGPLWIQYRLGYKKVI